MNNKASKNTAPQNDREQRLRVLTTILTWTAEEFHDLGHKETADTIEKIRDKMAAKLGH